jgi:hypothetical protein
MVSNTLHEPHMHQILSDTVHEMVSDTLHEPHMHQIISDTVNDIVYGMGLHETVSGSIRYGG